MSELDSALTLPILIADDDADDRLLLKMAFSERNIPNPVVFFRDGGEVMDYLMSISLTTEPPKDLPGLMLLDVNMPRKNGLQVLQEVKADAYWKQICVCMFSTARTDHYVYEAQRMGADNYMVKPDTYEELLDVIQGIYDKWLHSVVVNQAIHPCTMDNKTVKSV